MRLSGAVSVCVLVIAVCIGCSELKAGGITRYVAPKPLGKATGRSQADAASFFDGTFWGKVKALLDQKGVTVQMLPGEYCVSLNRRKKINTSVKLSGLGNADHRLVIAGAPNGDTIVRRNPNDPQEHEKANRPTLILLENCRNLTLRNVHFRGSEPIAYALAIRRCRDVLVEACSWVNMPGVYYGATGAHYPETENVTWKACRFERIGYDSHAHMIYNAWSARNLNVIGNTFVDSRGTFVRFRAGVDHCTVADNVFRSTGTFGFKGNEYPFVSVPLFNDKDPASNPDPIQLEYFGTHFRILRNEFIYEMGDTPGRKVAFLFHHSGWNPPGVIYLLTADQARFLQAASGLERKGFYRDKMRIDFALVVFADNKVVNVEQEVAFESWASFGACSKGFKGRLDVSDLVNRAGKGEQ